MEPLMISTGRPADGKDKYFERPNIENKIWFKIKQKENLLLAAPRRTGKSSILKNIERNPQGNYLVKYKAVQSVDSINALMHLMKDEYPKEYFRMGAELKETVSEILDRIHAM
jgi:AAA+ ATPase superfamily predicted ATPase